MRLRLLTALAVLVGSVLLAPSAEAAVPTSRGGRDPGCTGIAQHGRSTLTLTSGGVERTAIVYLPTSYDGRHRVPLFLNLHGSASNPAEQLDRSRMEASAERHGYVVVAPRGGIASGENASWNVPYVTTAPVGAPDDELFLADLISTLTRTTCVAPQQVYLTGYSGGGRMVSQFACDHADLVAGIAPVAGLRAGRPIAQGSGFAPDPATCKPSRPVPVITFAGTADPVNPYAGGGAPYWGYGTQAAQQRWAQLNGCHRGPVTTQVTTDVTRVASTACRRDARVLLYVVAGGGHTWPGGDPAAFPPELGIVTQQVSADELMWSFFRGGRRA